MPRRRRAAGAGRAAGARRRRTSTSRGPRSSSRSTSPACSALAEPGAAARRGARAVRPPGRAPGDGAAPAVRPAGRRAVVRRVAARGAAPPGWRCAARPTADLHRRGGRLPVAAPRTGPRRSGTPSPACSTRCRRGDVDGALAAAAAPRARRRARRTAPGDAPPHGAGGRGHRHQRQDHDLADGGPDGPVRRARRRLVVAPTASTSTASWSRRATTPVRAARGRVLDDPRRAARRHRDGPRRHPAARPRRGAQRRLGRHQRQRRPPRPAGRRHRRPARRGEGGHHPGDPAAGWVVLNGDDPRTFAMRLGVRGPGLRLLPRPRLAGAAHGARTRAAGRHACSTATITVLDPAREPDPLVRVVDVPMTLAGLSHVNVENALAAAGAGLGVGLPRGRGGRRAAHRSGPDPRTTPAG